jgi:hypothetical protein
MSSIFKVEEQAMQEASMKQAVSKTVAWLTFQSLCSSEISVGFQQL